MEQETSLDLGAWTTSTPRAPIEPQTALPFHLRSLIFSARGLHPISVSSELAARSRWLEIASYPSRDSLR